MTRTKKKNTIQKFNNNPNAHEMFLDVHNMVPGGQTNMK